MQKFAMHIGGRTHEAASHLDVLNPATGEAVALMPVATQDNLDRAVAVAVEAFDSWSKAPDSVLRRACRSPMSSMPTPRNSPGC